MWCVRHSTHFFFQLPFPLSLFCRARHTPVRPAFVTPPLFVVLHCNHPSRRNHSALYSLKGLGHSLIGTSPARHTATLRRGVPCHVPAKTEKGMLYTLKPDCVNQPTSMRSIADASVSKAPGTKEPEHSSYSNTNNNSKHHTRQPPSYHEQEQEQELPFRPIGHGRLCVPCDRSLVRPQAAFVW